MTETIITELPDPSGFSADPLTDILRSGARTLIQQAVEAELTSLLAVHADEKTQDGHARLVRHGHLPERDIMTHCPAGFCEANVERGDRARIGEGAEDPRPGRRG